MNEKDKKLVRELYTENAISTNRLAAKALLVLGLFVCCLAGLDLFHLYRLGGVWARRGVFISGLMGVSCLPLASHFDYKARWIKHYFMGMIVISSGISFFLYPFNANFLTYGPIVISAMYYDPRIIKRTAVFSWITYVSLLLANCILEETSAVMQAFHAFLEITIFRDPIEVFVNHFLPHCIFFYVVTAACSRIAKHGWETLLKQAKITEEVTAMERDLGAATEMQIHSLPGQTFISEDERFAIKAFMRPAKAVGGDFYDYFIKGDNVIFLVADVSDKGLPAALFMMKAKDAIRASFRTGKTFEEAVATANLLLCNDNSENMFCTAWIGSVNQKSGVGKYANCGHIPPFVKHRDGTIERITNSPDLMLGVFEDTTFASHPLVLSEGDTLIVFTDGLTDAINENGDNFGEERLMQIVQKLSADTLDTSDYLISQVDDFVGNTEQFDDMTSIRAHFFKTSGTETRKYRLTTKEDEADKLLNSVNGMLSASSCPEDTRRNIDVSIDEVCENIREYAYGDNEGSYEVSVCLGDNFIRLTFTDEGEEFNPLAEESVPSEDGLQIGGLGIFLYKTIMDEVSYERKENKNRLQLLKIWNM